MIISDALRWAEGILRDAGVAEYRRESASLLAFVLAQRDVYLIAHPDHELTAVEMQQYQNVITRRSAREPFQYIVKKQEFYGLSFEVGPEVLIPRPETETLVKAAIDTLSTIDHPTFLEIGVGSGCISISILRNVLAANAVGIDISKAALEVARRNAISNGVGDRLDLRAGDLFLGVTGTFNLLVSNPPYVPEGQIELLQEEVRRFEPHTALSGGESGLEVISRIVADAPDFLEKNGVLLMEIGFDQSERVLRLFSLGTWREVEFLPDLQGIPRIVKATCL